MSVRSLLQEAFELIQDPARWTKGTYFTEDDDTRYCSMGALHKVATLSTITDVEDFHNATNLLLDRMRTHYDGYDNLSIEAWNDGYDRTHEEVLDLFKDAIVHAPLD